MEIFGVFPRIGAVVLALILVAISAATIGVINNNESLVAVRDFDGPGRLGDELQDLQSLILLTQAAAGWIIVLDIGIVIAEIIAIVIVSVGVIFNLQATVKLVFAILEIIFTILAILCYLATGIATASYAAKWGEPPDVCEIANEAISNDDDVCDSIPLTATNALEAVFCFFQIGAFGLIILMTIVGLSRRNVTEVQGPEKAVVTY